MKKVLLFIQLLVFSLAAEASDLAREKECAIVFRDRQTLTQQHPYLEGIKVNLLPLYDKETLELREQDLNSHTLLVENEYAFQGNTTAKPLTTLGIYDCIACVIPDISLMMHVHAVTDLKSITEALTNHQSYPIQLYTCSLTPHTEKVINSVLNAGIIKEYITLFTRPIYYEPLTESEVQTLKSDIFSRYSFSLFEELKLPKAPISQFLPERYFIYATEEEKVEASKIYIQSLIDLYVWMEEGKGNMPMPSHEFVKKIRAPLNIFLQQNVPTLFKIEYEAMRQIQTQLSKVRNSLRQSPQIVKIEELN